MGAQVIGYVLVGSMRRVLCVAVARMETDPRDWWFYALDGENVAWVQFEERDASQVKGRAEAAAPEGGPGEHGA